MRILNISLEKKLFEDGSAPQKRVAEYSRLFDRFDLVVMTGRGYKNLEFKKMEIWPTNSFGRLCYLFDAWRLSRKMVKKYSPQLVSVQEPFETGILGWLLAKKFGLKLQVQVHGDFFGSLYWRRESFLNRVRYYVGRFIVERADGIRVVSQRVKKSLLKVGIAEEKIEVVPIYTDLRFKNCDLRIKRNNNRFIFLTAGRLVKVKNIHMQIEAMSEIVKKYPQTQLWIVGDGPERKNFQFSIFNFQLGNNVKLLGWQNDLSPYYSQADAFLLTSNYEGWSMAVVEAAGFGLPIIMTDVGCAGELIKNGESGIIIPIGDGKSLSAAMINLMNDAGLRRQLGQAAKEAVSRLPDKEENLLAYKKSCEMAIINK